MLGEVGEEERGGHVAHHLAGQGGKEEDMVPVRQLAGQERGEVVGEAEEAEKGSQQGIVDGQAAAVEEQGIGPMSLT